MYPQMVGVFCNFASLLRFDCNVPRAASHTVRQEALPVLESRCSCSRLVHRHDDYASPDGATRPLRRLNLVSDAGLRAHGLSQKSYCCFAGDVLYVAASCLRCFEQATTVPLVNRQ